MVVVPLGNEDLPGSESCSRKHFHFWRIRTVSIVDGFSKGTIIVAVGASRVSLRTSIAFVSIVGGAAVVFVLLLAASNPVSPNSASRCIRIDGAFNGARFDRLRPGCSNGGGLTGTAFSFGFSR